MWIYILIGVVVFIVIAGFYGNKESKKAGEKARALFVNIENKYSEYVEKQLSNHILTENNLDFDEAKIMEQILTILQPEIDAVIAHIEATTYSSVKVNFNSDFFNNAVSKAEVLFEKSKKNRQKLLTDSDKKDFTDSFASAINADITRRLIDYKGSEAL